MSKSLGMVAIGGVLLIAGHATARETPGKAGPEKETKRFEDHLIT